MRSKILLAEDESLTRRYICESLRNEGYEVAEASDGAQAAELVSKSAFDLVITDFVMPHVDGFKLINRVRSTTPETPIILMSAYLSIASAKTILQGTAEFLMKPITPEVLLLTVQRLLRSKTVSSVLACFTACL